MSQVTLATCHHGVRAACVGAGGGEVIEELLFHEALIDGREFQGILGIFVGIYG